MVDKKVIAIAAGTGGIVAIFIIALIVNYYAISNLQFRAQEGGEDLDLATFSASALIDACNPTAFPASFEKYTVDVYYKNENFASVIIDGATIMPNDSETLRGTVDVNGELVRGMFLKGLADAFSAESDQQASFSEDVSAKATFETRLGIIAISETKDFDLSEDNPEDQRLPFSTKEYSCT